MPLTRVFLGWNDPAIVSAARWLLARGALELSTFLVVVPGSRAGRLLKAALVEQARTIPGGLSPPIVVTPGEIGPALFRHHTAPAGDVSRRVAWIAALTRSPSDMALLLRHPPAIHDTPALSRVAAMLERLSNHAAGAGLRMSEVAEVGSQLPDFADAARWEAAGRIQHSYDSLLHEQRLHDAEITLADTVRDSQHAPPPHASQQPAVKAQSPGDAEALPTFRNIVLLGVSELTPVIRAALSGIARGRWGAACDITALVIAEVADAHMFDDFGCAIEEVWDQAPVADRLTDAQVVFADSPTDQAAAALDAIAALDGAFSAEDIVIGVPDQEVMPALETAGRRVELRIGDAPPRRTGIRVRAAAGRTLAQTSACALVHAVGQYVASATFQALASLVRHPDVERWLVQRKQRAGENPPQPPEPAASLARENWLGSLDAWASESLPTSASDALSSPRQSGRPATRGGAVNQATVRWLVQGIEELVGGLISTHNRPVGDWGDHIVALLARAYAGRDFAPTDTAAAELIEACDRLRSAALDLRAADWIHCSAADAIAILIDVVGDQPLPTQPTRDAIESLGWLELTLDPGPVAIVTGFNEGLVPAAAPVEPMLPDALRRAIGLPTSRSRAARDASLLWTLLRAKQHVTLIAGRRTASGDPLLPSRLLFRSQPARAAQRLAHFTAPTPTRPAIRARHRIRGTTSDNIQPMPTAGGTPPDSLPVTAFSLYLRSPYEFYLKYILRKASVEQAAPEMDARLFGNLIHDAMARLAVTDAASSDNATVVAQATADLVTLVARERFGHRPRASVRVQIEVARNRLELLAPHQARRAAEGWRIAAAEWRVEPGGARLDVDSSPIGLHGAIDRIDRHEDGRWALWDYKTGENIESPDAMHRAGRDRQWIDLQLPLYRHLLLAHGPDAARAVLDGRCQIGYIKLGASQERIGFDPAEWSASDLAQADDDARDAVRRIRAGHFRQAGDPGDDRVLDALTRGAAP